MRPWTHTEEEALRVLSSLGGKACALSFDRPLKSIECKARQLGISLKRRSSEGKMRVKTSAATLRRVKELTKAQLCPECGYRFAAVKTTGLCALCHVARLKIVHEEETTRIEAQCELWASRSKLQRRRRTLAKIIKEAGHA